jgi:hypothetical protein
MAVRPEVEAFVALGPLPPYSVDVPLIDIHQERLEKITGPVSDEEAELLVGMFGPDDCFGLAWTLVHLIETAPGGCPIKERPTSSDNEWVRDMWARYCREPLVNALRRWHSASRDRLIGLGITMKYLESALDDARATETDRSALVDLHTELVIGRATVSNHGYCDLELLAAPQGEQILWRHHAKVSGIDLRALLDELARRMTMR